MNTGKMAQFDLGKFLIKYIWVIILLPKYLQLVFLIALFLFAAKKNLHVARRYPAFVFFFFGFCLLHSLSIFVNFCSGNYPTERILAAINTNLIWYVALAAFILIYSAQKTDRRILGKYALINLLILFGVYLFARITGILKINYLLDSRSLWDTDFINEEFTLRFCGLFEYSTLVSYFTVLMLPIAYCYLHEKRHGIFLILLLCALCYVPVISSNSRMGMMMLAVESVAIVLFAIHSRYKNRAVLFELFLALSATVLLLVFAPKIFAMIDSMIWMRAESTNTRLALYMESISIAWKNSPFIGMGIKDWFGVIPLGSHSTYVGVFYKTGLFGCAFFLLALFGMVAEQLRAVKRKNSPFAKLNFICTLIFLVMLLTEDLDGVNWLIVLFFVGEAMNVQRIEQGETKCVQMVKATC